MVMQVTLQPWESFKTKTETFKLISGKICRVSEGQWRSGGYWGGSQHLRIDLAVTPWDWETGGGGPALSAPERDRPEHQRQQHSWDPAGPLLPGAAPSKRQASSLDHHHPAEKVWPRLIRDQFLAQYFGLYQASPGTKTHKGNIYSWRAELPCSCSVLNRHVTFFSFCFFCFFSLSLSLESPDDLDPLEPSESCPKENHADLLHKPSANKNT